MRTPEKAACGRELFTVKAAFARAGSGSGAAGAIGAALCLWIWLAGDAAAFDRRTYCAGVYQCLGQQAPACTPALCEKIPGIDYSDDFCALLKELQRRGLEPATPRGRQIFARLGHAYRVTYEARGTLPLPLEAVRFLLDDIPFAAGLINAYAGTRYAAHYTGTGDSQFRGCNGKGLQGTFATVLRSPEQMHRVYFGHGRAQVLMWTMSGTALVLLECDPAGAGRTAYRFRSVVFPENRWVQAVLNFFLFRRAVIGNVQEILTTIELAARAFESNPVPPAGHAAAAPDNTTFEAFLHVLSPENRPGP